MDNSIGTRGKRFLNLGQYRWFNDCEEVEEIFVRCLDERQYVLRCLIRRPLEDFLIPEDLMWAKDLVTQANQFQEAMGIHQPYCYITVRHGVVSTTTDDVWHVDGFSQRITHLPEQNYLWANSHPTEILRQGFTFPEDFDPLRHNIQLYFQDRADEKLRETLEPTVMYCLDPYVIHRRPAVPEGTKRTMVRISFTPIEIMDDNNTLNPLIPEKYQRFGRDGRKDFRDKLERYTNILNKTK